MDKCSEKYLYLETLLEMLRLGHNVERASAPITKKSGLTPMQAAVLHFISCHCDSTVGEVFRSLEINQGNASSMCKRLEADGYITRRRSGEDERCVVLELTPRGRDSIAAIEREAAPFIADMDIISKDEKLRIIESLRTIKDFTRKLSEAITGSTDKSSDK